MITVPITTVLQILIPLLGFAVLVGLFRSQLGHLSKSADKIDGKQDKQTELLNAVHLMLEKHNGRIELLEHKVETLAAHPNLALGTGVTAPHPTSATASRPAR